MLFSDIRRFSTLAEGLPPGKVAAIFEHGGTLDKFIGDGIMATFGTPRPADDDALRAVRAARSMTDRGFPEPRHGIGVHCGQVIAGNVVNTADRLGAGSGLRFEPRGTLELKGIVTAIDVLAVLGGEA